MKAKNTKAKTLACILIIVGVCLIVGSQACVASFASTTCLYYVDKTVQDQTPAVPYKWFKVWRGESLPVDTTGLFVPVYAGNFTVDAVHEGLVMRFGGLLSDYVLVEETADHLLFSRSVERFEQAQTLQPEQITTADKHTHVMRNSTLMSAGVASTLAGVLLLWWRWRE